MAFKKNKNKAAKAENPAAHLKTLTQRNIQDVYPHQKTTLIRYAEEESARSDIALQLPTGGGKTLVGLLIADWRRTRFGERAVFLCPTVQLVDQTVKQARDQYGIPAADFSGPKSSFDKKDETAYKQGRLVAVTTYKGLFNSNPFFDSPDIIIADDAHVAENYIAGMWTLELGSDDPAHAALISVLRPYLTKREVDRLTGVWKDAFDVGWVDKLPSPIFRRVQQDVYDALQASIGRDSANRFSWNAIKDNLPSCHIFLSSRSIVIRPLIPPTWNHSPFADAKQRIYMSATLGEGGDTERLVGQYPIRRMAAPDDFEAEGVGRRFFVFPSLSMDEAAEASLRLQMQSRAGRSVVLTPSKKAGDSIKEQVKAHLPNFTIFSTKDIEANKPRFAKTDKAVAVLPGRFDGIDFPGDECRLLCIDGFPGAMNLQERFLMSKMGAKELYDARLQIRVLQAIGRCTRAINDRSAIVVTGKSLVDHLADQRKWLRFKPELQAELAFGTDQSTEVTQSDVLENFDMFIANDEDWQSADSDIREDMLDRIHEPFEANSDLSESVGSEIQYLKQMWDGDFRRAAGTAKNIQTKLNHVSLRGYRALWLYLEGSALDWADGSGKHIPDEARKIFMRAARSAKAVSWLTSLAYSTNPKTDTVIGDADPELQAQIERVAIIFDDLGVVTNAKFEKLVDSIRTNLSSPKGKTFEQGLEDLGKLLGFQTGNSEETAAPDPWWYSRSYGMVFEANSEVDSDKVFGSTKARQVADHPKWLKKNRPELAEVDFLPILITAAESMDAGASSFLDSTRYWKKSEFMTWSEQAIGALRELKSQYQGGSDLTWRAFAMEQFETRKMSQMTLIDSLPLAKDALKN